MYVIASVLDVPCLMAFTLRLYPRGTHAQVVKEATSNYGKAPPSSAKAKPARVRKVCGIALHYVSHHQHLLRCLASRSRCCETDVPCASVVAQCPPRTPLNLLRYISALLQTLVKPTVAKAFLASMQDLNVTLLSTTCNFIRCIKPNAGMQCGVFNNR